MRGHLCGESLPPGLLSPHPAGGHGFARRILDLRAALPVLGDPLSSFSSSSSFRRHRVSGTGMHIGLGRGHLLPIISQRSSSWQRDVQEGTDRWTGIRGLQRPATWLCSLP